MAVMAYVSLPSQIPSVIEVTREPPGISMCQLVRNAYVASRQRVITLVLNGVTTEEVDAALDSIVPLYPLDIPGLKYVLIENWQCSAARLSSDDPPVRLIGDDYAEQ